MGFVGFVVSGCGFMFIGLWQAWISLSSKCKPSPPLFRSSAQLISVAALAVLHIISGAVASHKDQSLADGIGSAVPLERSSVALVFFIFAIANLLSQHTSILPLPLDMSCLMALFAFGQELLLFYLQRPDAGLESRYYTLLLVPISACILAVASSMVFPDSPLPSLGLAGGLFLQGTWLLQMAFSFFTSAFLADSCDLHMRGEGDYVIKCEGSHMALMRGKAVATLQFNCHMALLLIIMLPLYAIKRKHHYSSNLAGLNYEMVATAETYDSNRHVTDVSEPPASAFSIGSEEAMEEDERSPSEHHHDVNGFHKVSM